MVAGAAGAGGAGGAGGALLATGAVGALFATGAAAGAGAAGACFAGGVEATSSSSSDFLPFGVSFLMLTAAPLLVTEMHDSELQLRGASMWILCPSISKEIPPAWAAVEAISRTAAAAR